MGFLFALSLSQHPFDYPSVFLRAAELEENMGEIKTLSLYNYAGERFTRSHFSVKSY